MKLLLISATGIPWSVVMVALLSNQSPFSFSLVSSPVLARFLKVMVSLAPNPNPPLMVKSTSSVGETPSYVACIAMSFFLSV